MKHTLYIGEDCHDCSIVVDFIKENKLDIEIIHADEAADKLTFDIFVRPALMRDDSIVGYGVDVVDYIKEKVMV